MIFVLLLSTLAKTREVTNIMILLSKIKNIKGHLLGQILIALLLTILVVSKSLVLVHSFSHQNSFSSQSSSSKASTLEKDFGKISFAHTQNNTSKEIPGKFHDCSLCNFANFLNQISVPVGLFLCLFGLQTKLFLRVFDRVKTSFLRSSFLSRAPPQVS